MGVIKSAASLYGGYLLTKEKIDKIYNDCMNNLATHEKNNYIYNFMTESLLMDNNKNFILELLPYNIDELECSYATIHDSFIDLAPDFFTGVAITYTSISMAQYVISII